MAMWDPWRGCQKYSEGCLYCYIHKGDLKRGVDTNNIVRTAQFNKPIETHKNGQYKMPKGLVYVCFSSDFLIEAADEWREACWQMIKKRQDCMFLFLTKRIERFEHVMPSDWSDGYDNLIIGCTIENQATADLRLPVFSKLPIKHKQIIAQPLLERIDITPYLDDIECVVVGGESDQNARALNYAWVLDLKAQCVSKQVRFEFRQCGTHFIKDNKRYKLSVKDLIKQAKKANINYIP